MRLRVLGVGILVGLASLAWRFLPAEPKDPLAASACIATDLEFKDYPKYSREITSHDYALPAVAALNAYPFKTIEPKLHKSLADFTVGKFDTTWRRMPMQNKSWGLQYIVFIKDTPQRVSVIVAIRGTDEFIDLHSNLSWFTQLLPLPNQYDLMRDEYRKLRAELMKSAKGKKLEFMVTGHSLGGALAHHLAIAFHCTSAVTFNSSPVENGHYVRGVEKENQVFHVYRKKDWMTSLRYYLSFIWLARETEDKYFKKGNMGPGIRKYEHSMTRLAVGMMRRVAECQQQVLDHRQRPKCHDYKDLRDRRPQRLYCTTAGNHKIKSSWYDPCACGKLPNRDRCDKPEWKR